MDPTPENMDTLGQQVLAMCQHRADAAGWQTKRWRIASAPTPLALGWDDNAYLDEWLFRINVDFICPCGGTRTLTVIQSVSAVLLLHAAIDPAVIIAESTAAKILLEFQKHTNGEPHP